MEIDMGGIRAVLEANCIVAECDRIKWNAVKIVQKVFSPHYLNQQLHVSKQC